MKTTWRHAVLFEGSPSIHPGHLATARELLVEWGSARGLTALEYVTQQRDYRVGYGMEFAGTMNEPSTATRLQGSGRPVPEPLAGFEEVVPWPLPTDWPTPLPTDWPSASGNTGI